MAPQPTLPFRACVAVHVFLDSKGGYWRSVWGRRMKTHRWELVSRPKISA